MAEWWEAAPVVEQPSGGENWWQGAEVVQPVAQVPTRSTADSTLAGALDTATFGFADELAAGIEWLPNQIPGLGDGRSYEQSLSKVRGELSGAQQDHPWAYTGGQLAGGLTAGIAAAPASISARVGSSLMPRVAAGVADGAIFGGAYGAGSGEGLGGRAQEAAFGAGLGGLTGAAFPLLGAGASKAYEAGRNALNARPIAREVGSSPDALRLLGEVMEADGSLGPRGAANMAQAGGEAMLADAGPNARAVLDTAIQRGGPGAVSARDAINERVGRSSASLTGALDDAMGRPGESLSRDMVVYGDKTNPMSLLYKKAYETPIDYSSETARRIEAAVKNRVPPAAISAANNLMRVEGNHSKQILAKMADDGSVVFETLPDVRQLDYITRGLNEVAEQADGAGKLGGTTATGRAYANLSREIRNDLKDLVPEYRSALDRAGTEIRKVKAQEFGSSLLSPSVTRAQVEEFVRDMPLAEKQKLTQGVRQQIDDAMARVTRTVQDGDTDAREAIKALKDLSSRSNREKIAMALGQNKADPLFREIDRAATSFDLRASVTENSKTFARQATQERIGQLTQAGPVGKALQGEPIKATQRIAQMLTGQTPDRVRGRENEIYSEIARLLTRQGGAGNKTYDAVGKIGQTDEATRIMGDRIARALLGPQFAYPATTQLLDKPRSR